MDIRRRMQIGGGGGNEDQNNNYLTIEALENGLTASLSVNACEYCVDGDGNWKTLSTGTATESVNSGHTLSFRGNLTPNSSKGIGTFTINKKCNLKGNCMSMLFGDNAADNYSLSGKNYAFYKLFYNCSNIVNVSSNFLPATTLADYCYRYMFQGCTSLTTAPELPARTLANSCYQYMFYNCTSLTTAPELPANTLVDGCYMGMFDGCTSLTTAPELPATTLADYCYYYMFYGCTSLTIAPKELPATTLARWCYDTMFYGCTSLTTAPSLPATTLAQNCYASMFQGCTSLTTAPELPAIDLAYYCYRYMFQGCTSLTTAPELPATDLVDYCYYYMFYGCTSLTIAPKELPATTLANSCYQYMFYNCTSLTTAPSLPATTLAQNCYDSMFQGCTSLTTAPELPATDLVDYCYQYMFQGCSSLTSAPELPATTLADGCYQYMFEDCASLTTAPALPATTLANSCYQYMFYGTNVLPDCSNIDFASSTVVASGGLQGLFAGTKVTDNDLERLLPKNDNGRYYLPATTLADDCYDSMFFDCTSLTTAPELPATILADGCYYNMFQGCTSLTTAPKLPATILADYCYEYMFQGCTSLNYIKCLAKDISATDCTSEWVDGVAATGTFVKNPDMNGWTTGINGIPTGWTVKTDTEEPLTFKISSPGTVNWTASDSSVSKTIEYKLNNEEWKSITSNTGASAPTITVKAGDEIQFRGNNATYSTSSSSYSTFGISTAEFEIEGNIMSLINPTDFSILTTLESNFTFNNLFKGCTGLTSTKNLILPATTLAYGCYYYMFQNCSSLKTAPELPARTLANSCYSYMFCGCTSLTTAPSLPATTLADFCYQNMFYGCTNLNYIKCLAEDISATDSTKNWVNDVASSGTFVKSLNTTGWTTGVSGIPDGWIVTYNNPLTFNILSAGTVNWTASDSSVSKTIEYKLNNGEWTSITSNIEGVKITVNAGDKIQFRGNNATYSNEYADYNTFSGSTAEFEVKGNIMSLINPTDFSTLTTLQRTYTFLSLFKGCTGLTSAENLSLPATTLADDCYDSMFQGCTSLTTAPELPATTLADYCYSYMFCGCASLTTAPSILPAKTLAYSCYWRMFQDCTSLTTVPALPATTLADSCYREMFNGCTSLTTAPALPATTLTNQCYYSMFYGCTSLTTAPELPANTLVDGCYYIMFYNCTSLNYIKCLATNISASNCTNSWVSNVASTGTFVKAASMNDWGTGNNGIPEGWTKQNA